MTKYWGPIRKATLRNHSDDGLQKFKEKCGKDKHTNLIQGVCFGVVTPVFAAIMLPSLASLPFIGLMMAAIAVSLPIFTYGCFRDFFRNRDGVAACEEEQLRRANAPITSFGLTEPQAAPAATAPVFNGVAAVTLETDVKAMKKIKISAKAAPSAQ